MARNSGSFTNPGQTPPFAGPPENIFVKHWKWWVAVAASALGSAFAPFITAKLPELSPSTKAIARAHQLIKAAERRDESDACGSKTQLAYQEAMQAARDAQRIDGNAAEPVEYEGAGLFTLAGCVVPPESKSSAFGKAADVLLRAEKLAAPDPLDIRTCMMLALALDHAGRREEARTHYEQVIRRCRNTPDKDKTADMNDRATKAAERIEALK